MVQLPGGGKVEVLVDGEPLIEYRLDKTVEDDVATYTCCELL